ncbi:hypothetical protein HYH02_008663 [Chlamydomonas schloesseri]|uniref:DOMON domain-containing protein n=1 Tax=Chlamydomonas schloesseri TaxID=2026947 RepID=A0A835WD20_9CHLO|nr:hypothetical protein HYH02_008663 [Chlamydomonas schloesseri]|eukprot:KAG2445195.1 hypothetical protein HYH02_008663 [Chlamydomonas schloesseri]
MARPLRMGLQGAIALFAIVLALASASVNAAKCYQYLSQQDYPNCLQLDSNLVLHYRTVFDDGVENLELAPDGDGYMSWVAIGISDVGMNGVDMNVIIRATEGYNWIAADYFTANYSMPTLDMEQNAVLVASPDFDKDNHTLAIWRRPLDSCDAEDVPVFRDVERTVIWAYNYRSIWDTDKFYLANYTRGLVTGVRLAPSSLLSTNVSSASGGAVSVSSLQPPPSPRGRWNVSAPPTGAPPPPAPAAASRNLTVAMPAFAVPQSNNSLACVNLALPNDTAYHVVAYQGFNTSSYVHHVIGYVCAAGVVPPSLNTPYLCGAGQAVLPVGCETVNFVWTPGTGRFTAPPQAGFAIGAGSATFMVLQVHYINVFAVGQVDSSGFTLTYTSQLRNNSMGVLTLGNTDLRIPAATDFYTALPNICPAACTARRVKAPVTLVSNFYMMNGLGVSSLTRHIRNGSAIQPVGRVNYWDYGYNLYQTVFPDSRTLLANDTLISLCSYNSTSRPRAMTFFGLRPQDELCFNYLTFYPVSAMPDLDYCVADTRKNTSTCATRTQLARMAALGANDTVQLANGTKLPVGTLNITAYKSSQCQLHDAVDVTIKRKPNTKAAVASVIVVPLVLLTIGFILWTKYSKQEEMEALLAAARRQGLDAALGEVPE